MGFNLTDYTTPAGMLNSIARGAGFNKNAYKEPERLPMRAQQMADAFRKSFPSISNTVAQQIAPTERALTQSLLQNFPQLAQLQRQQTLQDQQANLGLAQEDIRMLAGLDREISPEFFNQVQPQLLQGSMELFKPQTGGETEAIDRYLGRENVRTGTQFTPNQSTTVANATTFGNAARDRFSQALTNLGQMAPIFKNAMPQPFRQIQSSPGLQVQAPTTGAFAQSQAGGTLGNIGELQNTAVKGLIGEQSDIEKLMGSMPSYSG